MNLQDTPAINWVWNLPGYAGLQWQDLVLNASLYKEARKQYDDNKTGPLTLCFGKLVASLSLPQIGPELLETARTISSNDYNEYLPDAYTDSVYKGYEAQLRILQRQLTSPTNGVYEFAFNGWTASFFNLIQKPFSRGAVLLNNTSPRSSPPIVQYNTLSNPIDTLLVSSAVNYTRRILATPVLVDAFHPVEIYPGANYTDPQEVVAALNKHKLLYPSCSHSSGGCSMMPLELGGVVGPDLKVHGVEGLSVVDSSVIPLLPAARLVHTVSSTLLTQSDTQADRTL